MSAIIGSSMVLGLLALRLSETVTIAASVLLFTLCSGLVLYDRASAAWRCPACRTINWKGSRGPAGMGKAPFCRKCGRPRPLGITPVELRVKEPYRIGSEEVARIVEVLKRAGLADALPMGTTGEVTLRDPIPPGTTVGRAHPTWTGDSVHDARSLPPYPHRPADDTVPVGIIGVNVDAVARLSGGMGSQFGYDGLYVSLLLSMPEGIVWDARAAEAY